MPDKPIPLILGNMTGEIRRHLLYRDLVGEPAEGLSLPDEYRVDILSEIFRARLGNGHPWLLGGEHLPPFLPGELEIARIVLRPATLDVVSVRARPYMDGIRYRAVDEYEGATMHLDEGTSRDPQTLAQMLEESVRQ